MSAKRGIEFIDSGVSKIMTRVMGNNRGKKNAHVKKESVNVNELKNNVPDVNVISSNKINSQSVDGGNTIIHGREVKSVNRRRLREQQLGLREIARGLENWNEVVGAKGMFGCIGGGIGEIGGIGENSGNDSNSILGNNIWGSETNYDFDQFLHLVSVEEVVEPNIDINDVSKQEPVLEENISIENVFFLFFECYYF